MRWKNITIPIAVIFLFAVLSAVINPPYSGEWNHFYSDKWNRGVFVDSILYEYLPIIILSSLLLFGLSRKLRFRKANLSYAGIVGPTLVFLLITASSMYGILLRYISKLGVSKIDHIMDPALILVSIPLVFCVINSVLIKYIYREKWKKAIISGAILGITTSFLLWGFGFLIYLMHGIPG